MAINYYFYPYIILTGGSDGSLDSLDGSLLKDGDGAFLIDPASKRSYVYTLDADSGATESSPDVIAPDTNAEDKRWILVSNKTDYEYELDSRIASIKDDLDSKYALTELSIDGLVPGYFYDYNYQNFVYRDDGLVYVPRNSADFGGWIPLFKIQPNATTTSSVPSNYQLPDEAEGSPKVTIGNGVKVVSAEDTIDIVADRIEWDSVNNKIEGITDDHPVMRLYSRATTEDPFNTWAAGSVEEKDITGIVSATGVVSSSGHGFVVGDRVWIADVEGMTEINDHGYVIRTKNTNDYTLKTLEMTITGITKANPGVVTTEQNHGFINGQTIDFGTILGMTELSGTNGTVANKTATTFQISGVNTSGYGVFSSGTVSGRIIPTELSWSGYSTGGTAQLAESHIGLTHPSKTGSQRAVTLQTRHVLADDYFETGKFGGQFEFLVADTDGWGNIKPSVYIYPAEDDDSNQLPISIWIRTGTDTFSEKRLQLNTGHSAAIFSFCSGSVDIAASSTNYVTAVSSSTTAEVLQQIVPIDGVLYKMYVRASGYVGSTTENWVVTVMKNGVATNMEVTLTGETRYGYDITNTATVSAGDLIEVRVVASAGTTSRKVQINFELVAKIGSRWVSIDA